jgi:hypothetical protein
MGFAVPDMWCAALSVESIVIHCSMSYVVVGAGVGGGVGVGPGAGVGFGVGVGVGAGVGGGPTGTGWLFTRSFVEEGAPGRAGFPQPNRTRVDKARATYFNTAHVLRARLACRRAYPGWHQVMADDHSSAKRVWRENICNVGKGKDYVRC